MSPLIVVFLGIIAFCALIQGVFFAALATASWKAAARVDVLAARAETELGRVASQLERVTDKMETLSWQARETFERAAPAVDRVADQAERAAGAVRRAAELPLTPFRNGSALVHGLLRAIEAYRFARRPAVR